MFTCYLEIFECINDWVAELVYLCAQFSSSQSQCYFPLNILPVQCCLYELLLGPALWPTLRLASLQVSPVWPDYCYIAGWPPVDHHQCNVSSVGARQITPITQTTIEQRGNIVTFSVIYSDSVVITACSNTIKVFQAQLKGQLFQWKTYAHFSWKLTIYTKFSLSEKL